MSKPGAKPSHATVPPLKQVDQVVSEIDPPQTVRAQITASERFQQKLDDEYFICSLVNQIEEDAASLHLSRHYDTVAVDYTSYGLWSEMLRPKPRKSTENCEIK